jgi:hypothetical protein
MSLEDYDRFVGKCDIAFREYSILAECRVIAEQKPGEPPVIEIFCEPVEAHRLLYAASMIYPRATAAIKDGIDRARGL